MMATETLDAVPGLGRLYVKAAVSGLRGGEHELPDDEVVVDDVAIDRDHLARYARVCGFDIGDRLPATYPHVLAFPLAVTLMARPSFPFALPGLVHVANRIALRRPIDASERLTLRARTESLRPHAKGTQFDVVAEAEVDGETVWTDVSTYLRRGAPAETSPTESSGDSTTRPDADPPAPSATWQVPPDTGRRYAAVSGDRNPIHLHPLTARLFGFPRPIAHGMWTKARCLAALAGETPERLTIDVAFRKPLQLPSRVTFASRRNESSWTLALRDARSDAPHLDGTVVAGVTEQDARR